MHGTMNIKLLQMVFNSTLTVSGRRMGRGLAMNIFHGHISCVQKSNNCITLRSYHCSVQLVFSWLLWRVGGTWAESTSSISMSSLDMMGVGVDYLAAKLYMM